MATISSAGIGSGLDVESIITKLMAVEQQPLTRLKTTGTLIQTKISAFGQIKSQFSTLSDIAARLADAKSWQAKAATSSATEFVTASISDSTTASPTSFNVEVQQLARSQSVGSASLPVGTAVGTGTLTIQLGKWADGSFETDTGTNPLVIEVAAGEDSPTAIAQKINAAGASVVATVVNDGTGERLLLRSKSTGESSGFRVQAQDDDGNNGDDAGLSRLAFDPEAGAFGMAAAALSASTQYAQNAKATLNGIALTSDSNTFSSAVPGLSFTAVKPTTTPVEVRVAVDEATITKLANEFVTAYNATNTLINQLTSYDAENKQAALLQGDATTLSLQNALRRLVGTRSEGGAFATLSDIGIGVAANADGNIALDSSKFSTALKSPEDLQALFTQDTGDVATQGVGRKLRDLMNGLLGTGGSIDAKNDALNAQLKTNEKNQDAMNNRLSATETRLRKQYTALDTQIAQMTALNTYITQQVAQWNKSTS